MRLPALRTGRVRLVILSALLALSVSGCHYLRAPEVPMSGEYFNYQAANTTLVVLLHGLGGGATNFQTYGTVEEIRSCRPAANIIGANSHFGYYREHNLVERLRVDIIQPARAAGITQIWFLGVSLGGMGTLVYQSEHLEDIEGIILMAPYLGEWDELEAYIEDPLNNNVSSKPHFVKVWRNLDSSKSLQAMLTVAYGEDDSANRQHRWLSGLLAEERVIVAPGGHRWTVWQKLWPKALQSSGICEPG
jgi:pimeloyl-ACP methyl ester carboxylesterase